MNQEKYSNISLSSLYLKYFGMIFGGMALLIIFGMLVISGISTRSQINELDRKSQYSLALIHSSLDSVLSSAITQASKLAYNPDVMSLCRLDRDYVHDYDAMILRLHVLQALRVARRTNLDYNITLYTNVNDYIISTVSGAQKSQFVLDSDIKIHYDDVHAKGTSRFFARRAVRTSVGGMSDKPLMTYYFGMNNDDFIAIDMDADKLVDLMTGKNLMEGIVPVVLTDSGECLLSGADGWSNKDLRFLAEECDGAEALGMVDVAGDLYYVYRKHSAVAPMTYGLLVPCEIQFIGSRDLIRSVFVIFIGGLALSLILTWKISKRVFRPIGVILDFVNSKGDMAPTVNDSYEVEHILLSILAAYQENRQLEKEQIIVYEQMRIARVHALQQQMTPHFLYNTLQAILWMLLEDMDYRESRSSESLKSLSHMARFCMEGKAVEVTIDEELAYVEEYLYLMRLRYGDKIQWSMIASREVRREMVPKLSIQPLVENAIRHSLPHADHFCVQIEAVNEAKCFSVCVRDNGKGMSDEQILALKREMEKEFTMDDEHIALINLNQRLKLIYGEGAGLFMNQREGMMEIGFHIERSSSAERDG